jgi:hypothetical protein
MGWTTGVRVPADAGIFCLCRHVRTGSGATQPSIQWVPGVLAPRVKRPGCEADHSHPSSVEVKNAWIYISTPPILLHGVVLS